MTTMALATVPAGECSATMVVIASPTPSAMLATWPEPGAVPWAMAVNAIHNKPQAPSATQMARVT
ncbi:hypothetical protein D3C83_197560 [compost metagenome]